MKPWGSTLSMSGNAVWGENKVRLSTSPAAILHLPSHHQISQGLTMPVSDVKMTISYKGASCWNKVSMPGRFLNLQPVASWGDSENSETRKPRHPQRTNPPREQRPSLREPQNHSALPVFVALGGFRSTWL